MLLTVIGASVECGTGTERPDPPCYRLKVSGVLQAAAWVSVDEAVFRKCLRRMLSDDGRHPKQVLFEFEMLGEKK